MSNQARHGLREAFLLQAFLQGGRPGEQGRARSQPVLRLLRPAALPVKGELPQAASLRKPWTPTPAASKH